MGGHRLKVLCAALYVHGWTQELGDKEVWGGSWALSIFSMLTKELHDGITPIPGEISGISLRPASEATFGTSESRGLQREDGSTGLSRRLVPTLWTPPAHV